MKLKILRISRFYGKSQKINATLVEFNIFKVLKCLIKLPMSTQDADRKIADVVGIQNKKAEVGINGKTGYFSKS